jgi:succinate-semialdehyde dehydrogenase/glutarate-semialdehyde dehydrogenase
MSSGILSRKAGNKVCQSARLAPYTELFPAITSLSAARIDVINPATGERIAHVPAMTREEVDHAIDAAQAAFGPWSGITAASRAKIIRRWFDLICDHRDALASVLTLEQGKPLAEARSEIMYAAGFVEWFAEQAKRTNGETIPTPASDLRLFTIKQPVGVVGAITPWNFPAAMITRKAAPALAAGCTMVLKPASATPLTALALCHLARQAGVPAGVLECVTGSAQVISKSLTDSPLVRKISFTGSTEIGRQLMAACSDTIKKVSLELGGNAPFIVFNDADLDLAVAGAMASKFRNAGQTCVSSNRFFVQAGILEAFTERLTQAVESLVIGDGQLPGTAIGPLIDSSAVQAAKALLKEATEAGATIRSQASVLVEGANFFAPTLLTGVTDDMRVSREEIFAPIVAIASFETEREVIDRANATESGLAAYLFTRDIARACRVSEQLQCGMIGINTGSISTEVAPFGGIKQSGIGREGAQCGIDEYLEIKYMCLGGMN